MFKSVFLQVVSAPGVESLQEDHNPPPDEPQDDVVGHEVGESQVGQNLTQVVPPSGYNFFSNDTGEHP